MGILVSRYKPNLTVSFHHKVSLQGFLNSFREASGISGKWPQGVVISYVTNDHYKKQDDGLILNPYFSVTHPEEIFGVRLPESEEKPSNVFDILQSKIRTTFDNGYNLFSPHKKTEMLEKMGAKSAKHVLKMADDRGLFLDKRIGEHPVFDHLRNHPDSKVREGFTQEDGFPGWRLKEITQAAGGVKAFYILVNIASADLGIKPNFTSRVAKMFIPQEAGLIPLPEEGIVCLAEECDSSFKIIEGSITNCPRVEKYDDVNVVERYDTTVQALRNQGRYVSDGSENGSPSGRILQSLLDEYDVPLRRPSLAHPWLSKNPNGRALTSNLTLGIARKPYYNGSARIAGHRRSGYGGPIKTLMDIAKMTWNGHGILIEDPQKSRFQAYHNIRRNADPALVAYARDIEAALIVSYHLIGRGMQADGRPLGIDEDFSLRRLGWIDDFYGFAALSKPPQEMYVKYSSDADLKNLLVWDGEKFVPNDGTEPQMPIMDHQRLMESYKLHSNSYLGHTVALLGSATTKHEPVLKDGRRFAKRMAQHSMTACSGGGAQGVMREFIEGTLEARKEGNHAYHLMTRAVEVSAREAALDVFLSETGLDMDDPYIRIHEMPWLAPRQHNIFLPVNSAYCWSGGIGSGAENLHIGLHNIYVELTGEGLFPGHENNKKKIPLGIVNLEMPGNRRYFDVFNEQVFPAEFRDVTCVSIYNSGDEAFEAELERQERLEHRPGKMVRVPTLIM